MLRAAPGELVDAPGSDPQQRQTDLASRLARVRPVLRRALGRHRRLIAAACAGLACLLTVNALAPPAPASTVVLAAAHDLPAGARLTARDLRPVRLPPAAVPAGVLRDLSSAVGRTTSGPLRRGEPLTDVRLDDGPLRPPAPGMVAAPVRLADAQAAALLRPGEHVDVVAASTAPAGAEVGAPAGAATGGASMVANDVTVVEVPPRPADSADLATQGALVVLATTPEESRLLAQAQVSARLFAVVVG